MVDLVSKSACSDHLPHTCGPVRMEEVDLGRMTALVAFTPHKPELAKALSNAYGLAMPEPGETTETNGTRLIWFGKDQVLLVGADPAQALDQIAAVSDQSDGWACVQLSGHGAADVLARLVPIDLRPVSFAPNQTARTLIGHMSGSVTCLGPDRYLLMVFRSMAGTLVHDVSEAMDTVVARQ